MDVRFIAWAGYQLRDFEDADQNIQICGPTVSAEKIKDSPSIQNMRTLYYQNEIPYQRDCN